MTKVREIIQDALIEIGAQAPADAMPAEDAAFGLRTLNRMIQKWNTEELMIYTVNRTEYPVVVGQQTYTVGIGGNINVARPVKISMVSVLIQTAAANPVELALRELTDDEWRATAVKNIQSAYPTQFWQTGNMPLNSLWLWPIPTNASTKLVLYTWGKTENFASLNDDVVFPNGYEEALVTNLGIALSNSYGIQVGPALSVRAASAKSSIESLNIEPMWAVTDFSGTGSLAIKSFGLVVDAS